MKINRNTFALLGVVAVAVTASPANLFAATNGFIIPSFRGSANSESGDWEIFSDPYGAPGNLPDQPGATTDAVLTQSNTNAFLTGSGNIYNLSTSAFTVADSAPFTLGTVVLQTRTVGSELDYNSVFLVYSNDSGAQTLAPLFRYELNRAAGQGYLEIAAAGGGINALRGEGNVQGSTDQGLLFHILPGYLPVCLLWTSSTMRFTVSNLSGSSSSSLR